MSAARMKTVTDKAAGYRRQNDRFYRTTHPRPLTARQRRQLRKTQVRLDHTAERARLKDKQRSRRARFREWMSGMR